MSELEADAAELVIASLPSSATMHGRPRPRQLGAYELIAELAHGGMGTVYVAHRAGEAGFERLFAIKVLHPHLARDPQFVAMLLDEARLAACIHHHNVASVLELGRSDHGHYLVMPYVEGCSLAQVLARSPRERPPATILSIVLGGLDGLHAAHTAVDAAGIPVNLVHRDVSPHNILIGVDGDARIVDFGVAKARARITSTQPGAVKGKLAYIAPEALEDPDAVDARADVFSMGAVLWGALTGRVLFRGDTDAETVRRILTLEVPPPSRVGLAPPAVLDAVVLRALARDPAARFPSAVAFASELRATALAAGLLAAPDRVGTWVRELFATELAERHEAIRTAIAHRSTEAPPAERAGHAVTAAPTSPLEVVEAPDLEQRAGDVIWFLIAVTLAFIAGTLVTLHVRDVL